MGLLPRKGLLLHNYGNWVALSFNMVMEKYHEYEHSTLQIESFVMQ